MSTSESTNLVRLKLEAIKSLASVMRIEQSTRSSSKRALTTTCYSNKSIEMLESYAVKASWVSIVYILVHEIANVLTPELLGKCTIELNHKYKLPLLEEL